MDKKVLTSGLSKQISVLWFRAGVEAQSHGKVRGIPNLFAEFYPDERCAEFVIMRIHYRPY
jgi:hypothetical protein